MEGTSADSRDVSFNTTLKAVGDGVKLGVDVENEVTVKIADGQTVDVQVKGGEVSVAPKEDALFDVNVKNEDIIVTPSEMAVFEVQVKGGSLKVEGSVDANIVNVDPIAVDIGTDSIDVNVTNVLPIDVSVANALPIDVNVSNADDIDVNVNNAESIDVNVTNLAIPVMGSVGAVVSGSVSIDGTANVLVVNTTDAPVPVAGGTVDSVSITNWPAQQQVWIAGVNAYTSPLAVSVKNLPEPLSVEVANAPTVHIDATGGPLQVSDQATQGYLSAYNLAALRTVTYPDQTQHVMQATLLVGKNLDPFTDGEYVEAHMGSHQARNTLLTTNVV